MSNRITAFLAIITFFAAGQQAIEKKVKQEIWANASPEFKVTEVPEIWKAKSAVVLATTLKYRGDFSIRMSSRNFASYLTRHTRIKLLDNAAIKEYSEFEFNRPSVVANLFGRTSQYSVFGIKIIKPNGIEREIDLSSAVKTDVAGNRDLKIPIPNLEVGDILDYFFEYKIEELFATPFGIYEILEGKYPIVWSSILFTLPHEASFMAESLYGAPKFTKTIIKKDVVYSMTDTMRDTTPNERWVYPFRSLPHVRLGLFSTSQTGTSNAKEMVQDVLTSFKKRSVLDIGLLEDFIDINLKKDRNPQKIATELYYLFRNPLYLDALFGITQGDPLGLEGVPGNYFYYMDAILDHYKIPHEVIAVPSRQYGAIETLPDLDPVEFMVKVKTNPPMFLPRPSPFRIANTFPAVLEGMVGKTETMSETMTESKMEANRFVTTLNIKPDPQDLTKLNVERGVLASGHMKGYHQYLVVTNYDYLNEYDQPKYQAQSSSKMRGLLKTYNGERTKLKQRMAQDYENRNKRITESLEEDLGGKVEDYNNLKLKSMGMWTDKPNIEYEDAFSIKELVKKAGPNFIISLGLMIGGQVELKEDELNRSIDIYQDYARVIENNITFNIPEGYSVEGIDGFNLSVENEFGGFTSTAQTTGKTITISIRKSYKKNFNKAQDWPKLTEFIKAGVEFNNLKLLLKKDG